MPPLTSTRILDLSRLLPGPYATQLLADLGAEVIKIETPRLGDYARMAPDTIGGDAMFRMINRGKKSAAVNYRNNQGREIFLKLAERADVVLETFKPGSMDRWGIGYEALKMVNPSIILCSISGYGQAGPYRDRVGHDLNYIAVGGLLGLTGEPGAPPSPPGVQTADLASATFAALNILAALLERGRTGEGRHLDVAMLDPVVHWTVPTIGSEYFGTGRAPVRGRLPLTGAWPCNRVYRTRDDRFMALAALEPPFWSEFCRIVDRPDLLPKAFDSAAIPDVEGIMARKNQAEWLAVFEGIEIPLDPVLDYEEMLAHPQVQARGLVRPPEEGGIPELRSPFPFPPAEGAAPGLGQDTHRVLLEAGYSEEEIIGLDGKGVIKIV
ncbi:MAG TPA: CaiB/BaiF CoA-transferase family protein [Anaerolineales bacterium]|nr:CaiB/BaiF CoA-transferase family protein [Anaerolineales bacterium]